MLTLVSNFLTLKAVKHYLKDEKQGRHHESQEFKSKLSDQNEKTTEIKGKAFDISKITLFI